MNTLPTSKMMTDIIQSFITENYSGWVAANDQSGIENNVEVYPRSEGAYTVILYKTRTPLNKEFTDIFEYNQSPEDNAALKDFCAKLEKYLDKLDLYKFKALPRKYLTKQTAVITVYPDFNVSEKKPVDLENFDIKELTRDSREKQNESTDTVSEFLKLQEWNHASGYVPNDGNWMVGGAWASSSNEKEYEKEVEVEINGDYYLVNLAVTAELDCGYDDSVNYSWQDIDIDEDTITLVSVYEEGDNTVVTDPELKKVLFEKAKAKLIDNKEDYFENDWDEDEPFYDYPEDDR
jgi:hypothetical protein